jgi:hypothetical protein
VAVVIEGKVQIVAILADEPIGVNMRNYWSREGGLASHIRQQGPFLGDEQRRNPVSVLAFGSAREHVRCHRLFREEFSRSREQSQECDSDPMPTNTQRRIIRGPSDSVK